MNATRPHVVAENCDHGQQHGDGDNNTDASWLHMPSGFNTIRRRMNETKTNLTMRFSRKGCGLVCRFMPHTAHAPHDIGGTACRLLLDLLYVGIKTVNQASNIWVVAFAI
jgi:hypothetical protein